MAVRKTTRKATTVGPAVELRFHNIRRSGGCDITFDLDVRPGTANRMKIEDPMLARTLVEETFFTSGTTQLRELRVSTERPVFVFEHMGQEVASAQVELGSGRPHVFGVDDRDVILR